MRGICARYTCTRIIWSAKNTYVKGIGTKGASIENTYIKGISTTGICARDICITNIFLGAVCAKNTYTRGPNTIEYLKMYLQSFLILEVKLFRIGLETGIRIGW